MSEELRAIDLCCGGGGWACAARGTPIRIVLAVDYWEPAVETYRLNHPHTDVLRLDLCHETNMRQLIDICRRERINLVLGGIPGEWLSVYRNAGLGNETQDEERETERALLDNCLALVKEIDPRWWCLEDVIGLAGELPILTTYQIHDARHWSPQRRKRIFVGRFPRPKNPRDKRLLKDALRTGPFRIGRRSAHRTPQKSRTFTKETCLGAYPNEKGPTVLSQCSRRDAEMVLVDPSIPGGKRQLEWQESAALQRFPEDYVFWGSPTDVSKMVGRAVQIDLARAILAGICREAGLDSHLALSVCWQRPCEVKRE